VKFAAYPYSFRGGVMVAVGDANGDCQPDIITGAGPLGTNEVRYFDGATLRNDNGLGVPLESITAFPPSVTGGVFVGGSPAMPLSVYEFTPPPPPGDGEGPGHRGSQAGQGPLALSAGAVQPTATDDGSAMTANELDRVFADDA